MSAQPCGPRVAQMPLSSIFARLMFISQARMHPTRLQPCRVCYALHTTTPIADALVDHYDYAFFSKHR